MNRFLTATALVAIAAFTAAPAFAAAATAAAPAKTVAAKPVAKPVAATPAKPVVLTFKLIDANHDGKISLTEIQKYWPKTTKADFAKYDTNKDGFFDHAELAAFVKAMAPAKPTK
jgi:hypothetical protein